MINIRRARSAQAAEAHPAYDYAGDGTDDPMAELSRLIDSDLRASRQYGAHAAPAGGYDDALEPIDLAIPDDMRAYTDAQGRQQAYADPWDDDQIDRFADELAALDEAEPNRFEAGVLPPHPDEEEAAAPHQPRRSAALLTLAAVALVALAGGAGYAVFMPGGLTGSGEPQLVQAPKDPYKIIPDAKDVVEEPVEGQAVFDGVPQKSEERLVTREETVPELPGVEQQVARVVLPNTGEATPAATVPEVGPRRVRTVNIRPDGTLIDSSDPSVRTSVSPVEPAAIPGAAALPSTIEGELVEGGDPIAELTTPSQITADAAPVARAVAPVTLPEADGPIATSDFPAPTGEALPAATLPGQPVEVASADPSVLAPLQNAPVPRARPGAPVAEQPAAPEPVQVASTEPTALPEVAAPAAAAPAAAASVAAAYVQLSSQRSEAAALSAYQALQRKYPSVLGSLAPDVQRADLGAKGIYYRARVGASTRNEAVALCEQLRSLGADCLIAKN